MDNLKEMKKCLEKYNLSKFNQEEIKNMNRPITNTDMKTVTKIFQQQKNPEPDVFTGKFYQKFREEQTLILLKLFQKIAEEGKLKNSFYKATIPLIPKLDKDATKKKKKQRKLQANITNITDVPRRKSPQQNFSKQNPTTHLKSYTMTKWAFIAGMQDSSILANQSM